jgi:hypothetical protein
MDVVLGEFVLTDHAIGGAVCLLVAVLTSVGVWWQGDKRM